MNYSHPYQKHKHIPIFRLSILEVPATVLHTPVCAYLAMVSFKNTSLVNDGDTNSFFKSHKAKLSLRYRSKYNPLPNKESMSIFV